jgi:hypothetical protein
VSGIQQLLVYADDVNLLGERMNRRKKHIKALIDAIKEAGLEANAGATVQASSIIWPSSKNRCRSQWPRGLRHEMSSPA